MHKEEEDGNAWMIDGGAESLGYNCIAYKFSFFPSPIDTETYIAPSTTDDTNCSPVVHDTN